MADNGDFIEYRRLILQGLERANDRLDKMDARLTNIEKDLTMITVKMTMYGAGAGLVGGGIVTAIIKGLVG
jgi:hypothetical protein